MSEPKLVIREYSRPPGFNDWYAEEDRKISRRVYDAILAENCENWLALDYGEITVGGQRYEWKLVEEAE